MTRPVLLDVDPGSDDAAMLALALASDEVEVVGVTTVAGNAPLEDTTRNALHVLERIGREDVPVVAGCDRPLVRELETAEHVHGPGGLPGERPDPATGTRSGDAVSFLLERARTVEDLTLVATGPLTNVAAALAVDPGLADRVEALHVMGGAVRAGGNVTPVAEYNFYADPEAAARVVRDTSPRVVGLDVTERATLPPETIESLTTRGGIVREVAGWLAYESPGTIEEAGVDASVPLHDPLVLVDLVGDVLDFEPAALQVDHGHGPSRGALAWDRRPEADPPNAKFAVDVDVEAFRETLLGVLEGWG